MSKWKSKLLNFAEEQETMSAFEGFAKDVIEERRPIDGLDDEDFEMLFEAYEEAIGEKLYWNDGEEAFIEYLEAYKTLEDVH